MNFVERNMVPETPADHNAPVGKYIVTASFTIDTTGNVTNIKCLNDPGYSVTNDVIHMLSKSPQWLPATVNGKPVVFIQKENFTYLVTEK